MWVYLLASDCNQFNRLNVIIIYTFALGINNNVINISEKDERIGDWPICRYLTRCRIVLDYSHHIILRLIVNHYTRITAINNRNFGIIKVNKQYFDFDKNDFFLSFLMSY